MTDERGDPRSPRARDEPLPDDERELGKKNKERALAAAREYRRENPEAASHRKREYYRRNRDQILVARIAEPSDR